MAESTTPPAAAESAERSERKSEAWSPKKGARCLVVTMRGGPRYVAAPGRVVAVRDAETLDVEWVDDRGRTQTLEHLPRARQLGTTLASMGWLPPAP